MKAAICPRYGPPEVLQIGEVPTPNPRHREALVRIRASTVNSSDWFIRSGLPDAPLHIRIPMQLLIGIGRPRRSILGLVLAGEVKSVGIGVTRFRAGDRVWAFTKFQLGGYAEYATVDERSTVALAPENLSFEDSAALVYGGLLGLHYVRRTQIGPGQRLVIYGASSGVGTAAIQIARNLGAEVTAVCGPNNGDLARSLGATEVLDYHEVHELPAGTRYDAFLDAVGKRKRSALREACERAASRTISVDDGTPPCTAEELDELRVLAESGAILPVIDRTWPLEAIAEAHAYVQGEHKRGNVVITMPA